MVHSMEESRHLACMKSRSSCRRWKIPSCISSPKSLQYHFQGFSRRRAQEACHCFRYLTASITLTKIQGISDHASLTPSRFNVVHSFDFSKTHVCSLQLILAWSILQKVANDNLRLQVLTESSLESYQYCLCWIYSSFVQSILWWALLFRTTKELAFHKNLIYLGRESLIYFMNAFSFILNLMHFFWLF